MIKLSSPNAVKWIEKANAKIDRVENLLKKYLLHQAQGAMMCAKARWTSLGEINSAYFFGLEKNKSKKETMKATICKDGTITQDNREVLKIQSNFYDQLYTSNSDIKAEIPVNPERKLNEVEKISLDKEFIIEEMQNAIKTMAHNKSPGLDGLLIDLYVVFYTRFKEILFDAISCIFKEKRLHSSAREGLITLLPKPNCNLNWVKNLRPIVLLSADFKLFF